MNNGKLFLSVLETENSEAKVLAGLVPGKVCSFPLIQKLWLYHQEVLNTVSSHSANQKTVSLYAKINFICEDSALMT